MGLVFLGLFAVTLFILYIAVRRGWGETLTMGGIGMVLSVLFVILFALTYEDTSVGQAIFSGIVVGVVFTVTVVIIAGFFRTNQPSAEVRFITRSHQEAENNGQRHDHHQTPE
jgi:hypothetical protein